MGIEFIHPILRYGLRRTRDVVRSTLSSPEPSEGHIEGCYLVIGYKGFDQSSIPPTFHLSTLPRFEEVL
jgi:hypothetical protein